MTNVEFRPVSIVDVSILTMKSCVNREQYRLSAREACFANGDVHWEQAAPPDSSDSFPAYYHFIHKQIRSVREMVPQAGTTRSGMRAIRVHADPSFANNVCMSFRVQGGCGTRWQDRLTRSRIETFRFRPAQMARDNPRHA
jgi:hypothetical protein